MGKEKKEIWKLLELLNEYEKKELKSEFYEWEKWIWWDTNLFRRDTRDEEWSHIYSTTADTYVISKKYGFIWWLVENDKIDKTELYFECEIADLNLVDKALMLLSIQDKPIEILISILK